MQTQRAYNLTHLMTTCKAQGGGGTRLVKI